MKGQCLACGGKFKNSLAFADHECDHQTPKPLSRVVRSVSLTRMSFRTLLQKDNTIGDKKSVPA